MPVDLDIVRWNTTRSEQTGTTYGLYDRRNRTIGLRIHAYDPEAPLAESYYLVEILHHDEHVRGILAAAETPAEVLATMQVSARLLGKPRPKWQTNIPDPCP